jgi:hypothetical protein
MARSGDGGPCARTGLSRRSYLVLASGLTFGRLPLPPLAARPTAKARRLAGPPTRRGDGGRNRLWTKLTDSGDVETMRHHPSSASGSPSSASSSSPCPARLPRPLALPAPHRRVRGEHLLSPPPRPRATRYGSSRGRSGPPVGSHLS